VQEAYRTRTKRKHPQIYHSQNTQHTEQRKNSGSYKREKQVTYKGKSIRITADFSAQTLNTRMSWKNTIQALKESICQPRLVYPAKLSFLIEGENKTFHNKEKLREFATTKPALQKILKGLLYIEEETTVRQVDSRKNKPF
jgi:hypothetical protein